MKFAGFDRSALDELPRLPSVDAAGCAKRRELLNSGLVSPARALLEEVVAELGPPVAYRDRRRERRPNRIAARPAADAPHSPRFRSRGDAVQRVPPVDLRSSSRRAASQDRFQVRCGSPAARRRAAHLHPLYTESETR